MIPDFYDGIFLPDGDHDATWDEVRARFCFGEKRKKMCLAFSGLLPVARSCSFIAVYLFGSFISAKPEPGDIDLLWVLPAEVKPEQMRPECRDLFDYQGMKSRFGWDAFCCPDNPAVLADFLTVWRTDKQRVKRRGIVRIDLAMPEQLICLS